MHKAAEDEEKIKIGLRAGSFLHYSLVIFTLENFQILDTPSPWDRASLKVYQWLAQFVSFASYGRRTLNKILDMVDFHERDD